MSKKLFITGTGTDIGKTYVSGLILKKLKENNVNAAYYKAAMSGNERDSNGNLIPSDASYVKNISGIDQSVEEMCPYVYEAALSPHLASKLEGNPLELPIVMDGLKALESKYDYITLEGSGGILCPLRFDEQIINLADFVKEAKLSSLIIADAGLGTINSVVLTVSYMLHKQLPVKGIIFNNYEEGNLLHEDNIYMCENMTGLSVLACVKNGDKDLNISADLLKALYE